MPLETPGKAETQWWRRTGALSPLMKTSKSQRIAKEPSIKRLKIIPKKIFYIQRQRRSHERVGGEHS